MEPPTAVPQVTTVRTTNTALASRSGDALLAYFLALGQEDGMNAPPASPDQRGAGSSVVLLGNVTG
ncbi:hypothetical protein RALTA_B0808 [Cupriavidus taiwanensis LMG 19424]|uniref:Uncharacterized protein n=1 Tax=Cupriavidus taiwanensis (strain DSM 17343 / BCRC 17206 / CCUG 44338 / CIP 107171 / LMG 19424 / R1) TaxID=977880 RepID=B3R949_CUPTR|nr:hypothetical protein RALTA_B0808 [Cupriavidus taiwanensis LMG 19424]